MKFIINKIKKYYEVFQIKTCPYGIDRKHMITERPPAPKSMYRMDV